MQSLDDETPRRDANILDEESLRLTAAALRRPHPDLAAKILSILSGEHIAQPHGRGMSIYKRYKVELTTEEAQTILQLLTEVKEAGSARLGWSNGVSDVSRVLLYWQQLVASRGTV